MADRALLAKLHARGLDIADAGAKAGYKHRQNAWRALKSKETKKIYERELKKLDAQINVSFEYKVKKLKDILEMCAETPGTAKVAVSAIAELNKMQGHHAAKKLEINNTIDFVASLQSKVIHALQQNV